MRYTWRKVESCEFGRVMSAAHQLLHTVDIACEQSHDDSAFAFANKAVELTMNITLALRVPATFAVRAV